MSYQVLAIRWRPKSFDEVMGQDSVALTLKNAIRSGRIAHAYLFTGPRGVGKTSCARILAKSLNCEKGLSIHPCGECKNCKEISSGISVDTLEIDGASNNSVEGVRNITENIKFAPYNSRYKIYIVDEVHMLSTSAFNALLKTLEEPPEHVIFVFATTEPHKIPATILSRCQRYDFRRISFSVIRENLEKIAKEEGISIDKESVNLIAEMSDGSMRDAQTLMDQVVSSLGTTIEYKALDSLLEIMDKRLLFSLLENVIVRNPGEVLAVVGSICDKGFDIAQCFGEFLKLFRTLFIIKFSESFEDLVTAAAEEVLQLQVLAEKVSTEDIHRIGKILMDAEPVFKRTDAPRMFFEMLLLKIIHLRRILPVEDILGRLGQADGIYRESTEAVENIAIKSENPSKINFPSLSDIKTDTLPRTEPESRSKTNFSSLSDINSGPLPRAEAESCSNINIPSLSDIKTDPLPRIEAGGGVNDKFPVPDNIKTVALPMVALEENVSDKFSVSGDKTDTLLPELPENSSDASSVSQPTSSRVFAGNDEELWNEVKLEVKKRDAFLYPQLNNFKYLGVKDGKMIKIQTAEIGDFAKRFLEGDKKELIEDIFSQLYGSKLVLEVQNMEAESPEYLKRLEREKKALRRKKLYDLMTSEPIVKEFIKEFNGKIDSFRIKGKGEKNEKYG